LIDAADAPSIDQATRAQLADGVKYLRDQLAEHSEPDRLTFMRSTIRAENRALALFRTGVEPSADETTYRPLTSQPAERLAGDPALATSGGRELAAALGLLGKRDAAGEWKVSVGPTPSGPDGALMITSAAGRQSAIYFAANGGAAVRLEGIDNVAAAAEDVVLIHSTEPIDPLPRSPGGVFGRTGRAVIRQVDMSALLNTSSDLADLERRFRQAAAL
jgi:hypothetical protein